MLPTAKNKPNPTDKSTTLTVVFSPHLADLRVREGSGLASLELSVDRVKMNISQLASLTSRRTADPVN